MANTVIVYGPQGCGKTRHADQIRHSLNCASVVDEWRPGDDIVKGAVHFTTAEPDQIVIPNGPISPRIMPYSSAANWANVA